MPTWQVPSHAPHPAARRWETTLKPGTWIETYGTPAFPGFPGVTPERLKIVRPRKGEGTPAGLTGWHIVQFQDGGRLCMHDSRFRVIGNHAN